MEFTIQKTGDFILQEIQNEIDNNLPVRSIGLTDYYFSQKKGDNTNENFDKRWIIRTPLRNLAVRRENIGGDELPPNEVRGQHVVLTIKNTIFRDSKLGGSIIMNGIGAFEYTAPNGKTYYPEVITLSKYGQPRQGIADGLNGEIRISGIEPFTFNSLRDELRKLAELEEFKQGIQKELEEKKDKEEFEKLELKLSETNNRIEELKKHIHRRINKDFGLGEVFILDPIQEKIKRSKVLDGPLIINGGPGTGKTTALIQRIKFLITEEAINEVKEITEPDKEILYNDNSNWIFFTPTELLRTYLKNAMVSENLKTEPNKVVTWDIIRKSLFKEAGLNNVETKRPFLKMTKGSDIFFNHNIKTFNNLNSQFFHFFIEKLVKIFERILTIEVKNAEWKEIGQKIKITSKSIIENNIDFVKLTQTFLNLNEEFTDNVKLLNEKYTKELSDISKKIQLTIKKEEKLFSWIENELKVDYEEKIKSQQIGSEEETEEEQSENELFNEKIENELNIEQQLNQRLRSIIRKTAMKPYDKNTKLNKKEQKYYDKIKELINPEELVTIGKTAIFKKYFEPLTKGIGYNILQRIPTIYKEYRRKELLKSVFLTKLGERDLEKSIKNDNNKRIHKDEMDFLLGFVFKIIRSFYKNNFLFYKSSNHQYIKTFKNNLKGIIAVDEATDFNLFELNCMYLLTYPNFNSITFSGDIMQRMVKQGIKSWSELSEIIPNIQTENLKISYRQTPELLKIAQKIHSEFSETSIDYKSKYKIDENDPKPLILYSDNFDDKVNWIADRILEINKLYGNSMPTIAIFVKNDNEVDKYSNALKVHETLDENFIETVACREGRILDDNQNVRVFSIEYIKGLEFEAVFFIDIDNLDNTDLLVKYVYVGVSRANIFLGLTINDEFPEQLKLIKDNFVEGKWTE